MIDIVVPVYRGYDQTVRCLQSLLNSSSSFSIEILVVNDASPDPLIAEYLETLAASGEITLLSNEQNKGFVHSVNLGMSVHADRDIVLLNSDAEVANNWLDRLRWHAYSFQDVGTVTPFSNNATICSYPFEGWHGAVPGGLGLEGLDALIASVNSGKSVALPTAVGFCMYLRRECLAQVGEFDAQRFGRGYGEENDFCRRAAALGWRHVLAGDVFVFHQGGVSFSHERHQLQFVATRVLHELHPDYPLLIDDFQIRDPVLPLRVAIDSARVRLGGDEKSAVFSEQLSRRGGAASVLPVQLHISHGWGGGTERWINDFCRTDIAHRNLVLRTRSDRNSAGCALELVEPRISQVPLFFRDLACPIGSTAIAHAEYEAVLNDVIQTFGVDAVIVSSLIGHALSTLQTGLPTLLVLHDLYPYCPALFACYDEPCAECDVSRLEKCLRSNAYNVFWHNSVPAHWIALRNEYSKCLQQDGIRIVTPSNDVWNRWVALLPELSSKAFECIPHGIDSNVFAPRNAVRAPLKGQRLRILIPGRLSPHKGLNLLKSVLPELLEYADVLLLGSGDFGHPIASMPNVSLISHYEPEQLADLVDDFQPDCALLLSVLPESYSYMLSEMWALRVPVCATRLGAFAERIQDQVTGFLFDPSAVELLACVRHVYANRGTLDKVRQHICQFPGRAVEAMLQDYQALLPIRGKHLPGLANQSLTSAGEVRQRLEAEVRNLRQALNEMEREYSTALDAERAKSVRLAVDLEAVTKETARVLNSRSWRLTMPLRWASSLARELAGTPVRPLVNNVTHTLKVTPPTSLTLEPESSVDGEFSHKQPNARRLLRHAMGVPDAMQLILVSGVPESPQIALDFLRGITVLIARCNNVAFLFPQSVFERNTWECIAGDIRVLIAIRRVFIGGFGLSRAINESAVDRILRIDDENLVVEKVFEELNILIVDNRNGQYSI